MDLYLVTGGAGFIGSYLVEGILSAGESVRVLDNFSTGKRENLDPLRGRLEVIEGDVRNREDVRRAVRGARFVLHQAAIPSVPRSVAAPVETSHVNVLGTLNVLTEAKAAGVERLLYASSSSVYGDTPVLPKEEGMRPSPLSPYAAAKLSGEYFCRVFSLTLGLDTASLRYFNVFGPRQDPLSTYAAVIPKFITALLDGEPPVVFGDGRQTRDFTYVGNVVEANLLACGKAAPLRGAAMNIASGERTDLLALIRMLKELTGSEASPRFADPRPGDVLHSHADISLAKKKIGYRPATSLREGLRLTLAWYPEGRAK